MKANMVLSSGKRENERLGHLSEGGIMGIWFHSLLGNQFIGSSL